MKGSAGGDVRRGYGFRKTVERRYLVIVGFIFYLLIACERRG